ncbi:hypothetical protein [Rhodococcus sp. 27YEA15]|uniref:DNA polymerase III subunit beta family protein n=1 Tax=Rhodococcus sp. 27YEA15 TaxID=3156259 RepID=UPI003C7CCA05
MPLHTVAAVLAGDVDDATRLLDEHVRDLEQRARDAALVAETVKMAFGRSGSGVVVSAAELADAIAQVFPAAAQGGEFPVLRGIFVEATQNSLVLTATDRYRLTTRTLVDVGGGGGDWSRVVDAAELAAALSSVRRDEDIRVSASVAEFRLDGGGVDLRFTALDDVFPDYRSMLGSLRPVSTRAVLSREALLQVLNDAGSTAVRCWFGSGGLTSTIGGDDLLVPATVEGTDVTLTFDPATLRPAVEGAVGPEIMVDISGPDQPVVIRSAGAGDLTTLVMPVRADS